MSRCLAEDCGNWTGFGCICEAMDLVPVNAVEEEEWDD